MTAKDIRIVWENDTHICIEAVHGALRSSISVSKVLEHDVKTGAVKLRQDLIDAKTRMTALAKEMDAYLAGIPSTPKGR